MRSVISNGSGSLIPLPMPCDFLELVYSLVRFLQYLNQILNNILFLMIVFVLGQ